MEKVMYRKLNEKIAELTGIFSLLVIPLSILSCIFYKNKPADWFYTVSDTYYLSPSFAVLMSCSSLLSYLYCGQNRIENSINRINAVSALLKVINPIYKLFAEIIAFTVYGISWIMKSNKHTVYSD